MVRAPRSTHVLVDSSPRLLPGATVWWVTATSNDKVELTRYVVRNTRTGEVVAEETFAPEE
ncbi:MAG: hypothetical protein QM655_09170 [Nocardioidaceae bacterium]